MGVEYPTAADERQARREQICQKAIDRARSVGRSIKCGSAPELYVGRKHAGEPNGCSNDGSTCICECHDPEE